MGEVPTIIDWNDKDTSIAELEAELVKRIDFMAREGYQRCDIAACNCGSWHGGNAARRLTEIQNALSELGVSTNGTTIIGAITTMTTQRNAAVEVLKRIAFCESHHRDDVASCARSFLVTIAK